jgi:hypothetical protein
MKRRCLTWRRECRLEPCYIGIWIGREECVSEQTLEAVINCGEERQTSVGGIG